MRLRTSRTVVPALCLAGALHFSCEGGGEPPLGAGGTATQGSGGTSVDSGGIGGGSAGAGNQAGEGGAGAASLGPACSTGSPCASENDEPGDSCNEPFVVSESGFVVFGDAFTDDFREDLALEHESCPLTEAGSSEAVFRVELEAGEELWVTQKGWLDAAIAVQGTCGARGACRAVGEERNAPVRYLANSRETVYVVVEAIQAEPGYEDYEIHIDIDPACGNGVFEGSEQCDDGNLEPGDGCASDCSIEFAYRCEISSPSVCEPYESIAELGADTSLEPAFEYPHQLASGEERGFTLTFTERVLAVLEATTRSPGAGNVDLVVMSSWQDVQWASSLPGDESSEPLGFEPGTYLVRFYATSPLPEGFEFQVTTTSPPECGNAVREPPFEACDNDGLPGCSEACRVDFGYECRGDAPSSCSAIESLGEFAAEDPIPEEELPLPLGALSSSYHMIRFLEPVLLSAQIVGIEPESVDGNYVSWVRFTNESGLALIEQHVTPSPFTGLVEVVDQELPADLYQIEVFTDTGLPEGYSLTLSTRTP